MKYLITYKLFEFVETEQNTPTLYKDENLEVKVSKTFDSTKQQNKDTNWCSSNRGAFYGHNKTANMYRINFKDGYKLRLTWDYITQVASELGSYSGGTHWGQGGIVDGERLSYDVLRPKNNDDPFYIDWQSEKKREIVDRIKSIPDDAKLVMMEYQDKMTKEKSELISRAFKEIELIKVIDVQPSGSGFYDYIVTVTYRGKKYEVKLSGNFFSAKELGRDIKNKYALVGSALPKYLLDKTKNFLKLKNEKNKNIYESYSLDEKKERIYLVNECEDIFYDLIHDGSSIDVSFPRKKTYSQEPADILRIVFNDRTRSSFNPLKYIDAFYHLDNFLKSRGWRYFSDGSWYDTHEKLMKSFQSGSDLLLLQINYIKE